MRHAVAAIARNHAAQKKTPLREGCSKAGRAGVVRDAYA
jgi:hypothetical protein